MRMRSTNRCMVEFPFIWWFVQIEAPSCLLVWTQCVLCGLHHLMCCRYLKTYLQNMDDVGAVPYKCIGLRSNNVFRLLSPHSLLSIPSVVVTISILANPQQSGGTHQLVARSVSLLPDVPADCVEQRPCRRRRTKSDFLIKSVLKEVVGVSAVFVQQLFSLKFLKKSAFCFF